jgi:hypothetical protein
MNDLVREIRRLLLSAKTPERLTWEREQRRGLLRQVDRALELARTAKAEVYDGQRVIHGELIRAIEAVRMSARRIRP